MAASLDEAEDVDFKDYDETSGAENNRSRCSSSSEVGLEKGTERDNEEEDLNGSSKQGLRKSLRQISATDDPKHFPIKLLQSKAAATIHTTTSKLIIIWRKFTCLIVNLTAHLPKLPSRLSKSFAIFTSYSMAAMIDKLGGSHLFQVCFKSNDNENKYEGDIDGTDGEGESSCQSSSSSSSSSLLSSQQPELSESLSSAKVEVEAREEVLRERKMEPAPRATISQMVSTIDSNNNNYDHNHNQEKQAEGMERNTSLLRVKQPATDDKGDKEEREEATAEKSGEQEEEVNFENNNNNNNNNNNKPNQQQALARKLSESFLKEALEKVHRMATLIEQPPIEIGDVCVGSSPVIIEGSEAVGERSSVKEEAATSIVKKELLHFDNELPGGGPGEGEDISEEVKTMLNLQDENYLQDIEEQEDDKLQVECQQQPDSEPNQQGTLLTISRPEAGELDDGNPRKVSLFSDDYSQMIERVQSGLSLDNEGNMERIQSGQSLAVSNEQLTIISDRSPPSPCSPSQSDFAESSHFGGSTGGDSSTIGQNIDCDEDDQQDDVSDETNETKQDDEEDFCGEMASSSTLRRIKMDTFEDVMVCEQNRESLESARRLFDTLVKRQLKEQQQQQQQDLLKNGRASALTMTRSARISNPFEGLKSADWKSKSLSSNSSDSDACCPTSELRAGSPSSSSSSSSSPSSSGNDGQIEDPYGTIKIIRRSLSSASSASNFRQTLVCSVSPTSQLNDAATTSSSSENLTIQQRQHISANSNGKNAQLILEHQLYPMDGDEILQCRAAFRENKRLIQEQQERAASKIDLSQISWNEQQQQQQHQLGSSRYNLPFLNGTIKSASSLCRLIPWPEPQSCSHCKQRLYPVDKMDLDFTKTTLNIHRNCFKCHICSSMLRLETYAAMDAKLYCPAHVKCVAPSR